MKNLTIKTNPLSCDATKEQEEKFREFCEQVSELAEEAGYTDFMISIRDDQQPAVYSTAVATDTLPTAYQLRDNAYALTKQFADSLMTNENFVLKRWAQS